MSDKHDWIISSAQRNVKSGLFELFNSRQILYALVKRELKARYRGSIFGFVWALGRPLVTLTIFYFVIGQILGASRAIEDFAVYLFVGMMFWGMFAESVIVSTSSIVRNGGLIQKVAFPREILPISSVVLAGINTFVQIPILLLGYALNSKFPDLKNLYVAIPLFIALFFLALALGLILGALNVYVRDIQPLSELSISLLMYASPILYSWTFVHDIVLDRFKNLNYFELYMFNPITILITGLQDALWTGDRFYSNGVKAEELFQIDSVEVWILVLLSIVLTMIAYKVFLKLEPNFAREL